MMKVSRKSFGISALAALAGTIGLTGKASAQASPILIEADVVRGNRGALGFDCVATSVFHPGDDIVWRAIIRDRATGAALDEAAVAKRRITAVVKADGIPDVSMHFGSHPPGAAPDKSQHYWTCNYHIPEDHAAGTMPWSVVASDAEHHRATFTPIGQQSGLAVLTIVAKRRA